MEESDIMTQEDIIAENIEDIKDNEKITIFVNEKQIKESILNIGYDIDDEGYLVFKSDKKKRVLSTDNFQLKLNDIGLIMPANSPHRFVRNNLGSLSLFLAERE